MNEAVASQMPPDLPPKDHHTEYCMLVIPSYWDDPQRDTYDALRHRLLPHITRPVWPKLPESGVLSCVT